MISFKHGNGLSMKSTKEFNTLNNNDTIPNDIINASTRLDDLLTSYMNNSKENNSKENNSKENNSKDSEEYELSIIDNQLFEKLEQLINSFETITVRVYHNKIYVSGNSFKINTDNIGTNRYSHYFELYWFIKTSLMREIYEITLLLYEKTYNPIVSVGKISYNPKNINESIKNIKKQYGLV